MGFIYFYLLVAVCLVAIGFGIRDIRRNGYRLLGVALVLIGLLVLGVYFYDIAFNVTWTADPPS